MIKVSDFTRHVATLAGGTAIAQAINLLMAPVLTRLYGPDAFGDFALFMSVVSAVAIVVTLRYEMAVMLPDEDRSAAKLVWICIWLSVFTGLVLTLVLLILHQINQDWLWGGVTWLLPLIVLMLGITQTLNNWYSRRKEYRRPGMSRIGQSSFNAATSWTAAVKGFMGKGLFLGAFAGQTFSAFWLLVKFLRQKWAKPNRTEVRELLKKYVAFPTSNVPFAIVGMLQVNAIVFILAYLFDKTVVGYFSRTLLVLQAPMWLMGSAVAQVFYQQASVLSGDRKALARLTVSIAKKSALVALPVYALIAIAGPELFAFVFGAAWEESGWYAAILAPYMYFDFIRLGLSNLPLVMDKQKALFARTALGVVILAAALFLGEHFSGIVRTSFALMSVLLSLYNLYMTFWLIRLPRKDETT
ncbi:MAG: oligosaccharide flippase family protein [Flavobacteriales bacterium]|nr:oligosaccharide flippase family protein [Flavobacteriales bacterium]